MFVAVPKRTDKCMDPPEADSHICNCAKAHRQIWKKTAQQRTATIVNIQPNDDL
jgi:hypothetical protein